MEKTYNEFNFFSAFVELNYEDIDELLEYVKELDLIDTYNYFPDNVILSEMEINEIINYNPVEDNEIDLLDELNH